MHRCMYRAAGGAKILEAGSSVEGCKEKLSAQEHTMLSGTKGDPFGVGTVKVAHL